jgi:hypothetical protein
LKNFIKNLKINLKLQTGDQIHYQDPVSYEFHTGLFICSFDTCSIEQLVEIYFNKENDIREFANRYKICSGNIMNNMHILRLAIELYKYLSKMEDKFLMLESNQEAFFNS